MPLTPAQAVNPTQRLLAFAEGLLAEIEDLDLDTIDGEFYWKWCRADLLDPQSVVPHLPRPIGFPDPTPAARWRHSEPALSGTLQPEGLFDYLRESLRFVEDILRFSDRLAQRFPRVVWQRLLYGERVAMRAAELEMLSRDLGDRWDRLVQLRVFSGGWSGTQVENELQLHAAIDPFEDEPEEEEGEELSLRMRFSFVDEQHGQMTADGGDISRGSYILVEVPLPLPPEGVIAREYEALVRQQHGWHLNLPGSVSRQEKIVAVRTWTIGLLIAHGVSVNDAIDLACYRFKLEPVSSQCFFGDRKRLIERVPEADPYLFAPTSRHERDTRPQRVQSLVSDTLASHPPNP